jgi:hypothetical protein
MTQRLSSYQHDPWRPVVFFPESDPTAKAYGDVDRDAVARRRRIEDIKEAARLEREVLGEVWDTE